MNQSTTLLVERHRRGVMLLGLVHLAQCLGALPVHSRLLRLQKVHGDGFGVGHLHELEPFLLQTGYPPLSSGDLLPAFRIYVAQRLQLLTNRGSRWFINFHDIGPGSFNLFFDLPDRQVRQIAPAALVTLAAGVVVEAVAMLAPRHHVLESAAAASAGQQPTQVMRVNLLLVLGLIALVEQLLDALEQLRGDERGVLARVLDTSVGDESEIVAVAQELGELGFTHWG